MDISVGSRVYRLNEEDVEKSVTLINAKEAGCESFIVTCNQKTFERYIDVSRSMSIDGLPPNELVQLIYVSDYLENVELTNLLAEAIADFIKRSNGDMSEFESE